MKARKWGAGENELFHYCHELEHALVEYYGQKKWHHSAGLFRNHRHVGRAVLAASHAIRGRLREVVTADDRLLLTVSIELENLDRLAKGLNGKGENLIEMLGCSLGLIARLLGYDWGEGKPNRQLAYSQTWTQIHTDDLKMQPRERRRDLGYRIEKQDRRQGELVATLFDEEFTIAEIARMLGMSQVRVKDKLVRCGRLSRDKNPYDYRTSGDGQPSSGSGQADPGRAGSAAAGRN